MALGTRIAQRLTELKQSQAWLAQMSGVEEGTISAIVVRDSKRSQHAPALANALGVELAWLLTGDGPQGEKATRAVQEPSAHYRIVSDDAMQIAKAWDALSPMLKQHYRDLIFRDAAIEKLLPYFQVKVPTSPSYPRFLASVEENMAGIMKQLQLNLESSE